jgi:predicted GIY-YIG superfamily endonuclease
MELFKRQGQPQGPTSVYVVACVDRVKIGIAKDVHARVIDLQFVCPFPVAVVSKRQYPTRKAAMLAERQLHAMFAEQRIHGEWFIVEAASVAVALEQMPEKCEPVTIAGRLRSRRPDYRFGETEPHNFGA